MHTKLFGQDIEISGVRVKKNWSGHGDQKSEEKNILKII